ncbi:hypothetical protein EKO27_g5828 [Xylaria grammica]|uniref:Rhodopsin domain-containing protein n=1 Tax=Xylaria grammica TaxID=363999 RepID=A0A439D4D7_9PEZI|nr:hypothetical protein EKO27_g5828 [Xylaria grammica]
MAETDYVTTLYVVSWALGSIVIVITVARILGRTLVTKQTGWDDFFMILGSLSAIVCSSLVTVGVTYGIGRHRDDIKNPSDLSEAIKYTIVSPAFSIVSSTSSKISILIFLVRLMGVTAKRWHLIFLWGLCAVLIILNVIAIVVIVRFCDPPHKQWQPWVPGTCIDPQIHAAGATIVKVYLLKDLDKHADITWYWAPITLWYTAEMDVIIIVGTIPTLWPLVRFIRRKNIQSHDQDIYNAITSDVSCERGSEGIQLGGSATRVLQEVDSMETLGTWNGERGQRNGL